ncbi:MAG: PAS domain-containing protein [candidate division WOR-3 bacterium]
MKAKVLVCTQDTEIEKNIKNTLVSEGHKVSIANNADTCLSLCKTEEFDIVVIDAHIPSLPYNLLVSDVKKISPDSEIIMIAGYTIPEALVKLETTQVNHYLILPLTPEKIKLTFNRVLHQIELQKENRRLLLAVTAAKKEWEATVDAIEEPIFVTDFDYKILRANLATFQLLQKGVNEVIGHHCYAIFHCALAPEPNCPGRKARDSGEPATDTIAFKGLKKRMTCSVYPQVFAGGGGLVHYLHEPVMTTEQEAQTMAKYERLFDDAIIPIIVVNLDDYKITDANQSALKLLAYDPEELTDLDMENIFAPDVREDTVNKLLQQVATGNARIDSKIIDKNFKETDVQIIANMVEVGSLRFIELFFMAQK